MLPSGAPESMPSKCSHTCADVWVTRTPHFRALGARSDDLKACSYGQVPLFSSCGDVMRSMIDGADEFDALCQARSGGGH